MHSNVRVCDREPETLPTGPERRRVALMNLPVCCHPLEVASCPNQHLRQRPQQPLPVVPWSTVLATTYDIMRSARRRSIQTPWAPTRLGRGRPVEHCALGFRGWPRPPSCPQLGPVQPSGRCSSVLRSPGLSADPWGLAATLGLPPSISSCFGDPLTVACNNRARSQLFPRCVVLLVTVSHRNGSECGPGTGHPGGLAPSSHSAVSSKGP